MFYATCNNAKIEYNQFTTGATWAWNWPQPFSSSQSSPSRWLPSSLLMAIMNNWQALWQMATEWQLTRWIGEVEKVDHSDQFCQVHLAYKVDHHDQVDQVDNSTKLTKLSHQLVKREAGRGRGKSCKGKRCLNQSELSFTLFLPDFIVLSKN